MPEQASKGAAGFGNRPTLLLLHGIGGSASGFAPLVAEFHRLGWPALAWSAPGYDGMPLLEPYDLEGCARALGAWLARSGPDRVVLVGHSMGGILAQTFYAHTLDAQNPDGKNLHSPVLEGSPGNAHAGRRIAGLVLAHTSSAFGSPGGDFQERFIASRTRALDEGRSMREIAGKLVPAMMAPTASPEALAAAIAMMAEVPPQTYRRAVAAITAFDGRAYLGRISVPTLCLAAEHDVTASPAVLQRMSQRIPGADYLCLEALGHLAPIEDARRWAAAVAGWCDRRIDRDRQELT